MRRFDVVTIHDDGLKNSHYIAVQHCKLCMAFSWRLKAEISIFIDSAMSLESVRSFFQEHDPSISVIVTEASSATVALAAAAHGVEPAQIAKTICLRIGERTVLVVLGGMARLDNKKSRDVLGGKPRLLDAEDVVKATSHPVGGVCPFGLPEPLPVYCDVSLQAYDIVVPAAGATNAAVRITPRRMAELTGAEWVDVSQ